MRGRDITAQTFGRLTAIEPTDKRASGYTLWLCQCECGNKKLASVNHLMQGSVKSCGCLAKEKQWTPEEINQLHHLVKFAGDEEIARRMGRTPDSIRGQRNTLGLKSGNPQNKQWSKDERNLLETLIEQGKTNEEIAIYMNRSQSAIKQAKYALGYREFTVRKWSEQELEQLQELSKEKSIGEIAQILNRDWTTVDRKCKALNIVTQSKKVSMRNFTARENDYIIRVSRYMTNEQIANKLERTEGSIKAYKSRLRKKGIVVASYSKIKARYFNSLS
ncbi:hypothetical protein IAE51_11905 [Lactococcus sp. S64]|uniref:hypothetical protein n=1 Tax=Lactococcus sp. S64 TaxID=2767459 RepID=UPI001908AEF8|nr:hypothetical protein [Lactococcus sp. S64]MBK0084594.1 hypothetical protein [Lactococcus sp. S64]